MTLRIEVAEMGLPALDALRVDAIAVMIGPERPLQGLAGYVDWRLCGAISRAVLSGLYSPQAGEALLLPTAGRLATGRVFCFGLPEAALTAESFEAAARRVLGALARAGCESLATSLPPAPDVPTARIWLEASLGRPQASQVLLGDPRALRRELEAARQAMLADAEVLPFQVPVPAPPPRPAPGLPGRDAVVP